MGYRSRKERTEDRDLLGDRAGGRGPLLHVDISHRIGRRMEGKTRPVIIRFVTRSTKDMIWKKGKGSEYLSSKRLRFGEDLTAKDKEVRNKLWPQIEAARKEGRKAFFVGIRAIIDGKELRPEKGTT